MTYYYSFGLFCKELIDYEIILPVVFAWRFGLFVANSYFVTAAAWQILSESA